MKNPFGLHQSIYFALGILIMKSVSLLMLPIVTYYLSPAQFGELELLLSISDFCTIIVGFGMAEALYRFAGLSKNEEDEKRIGATIFSLTMISGTLAFCLGFVAAPWLHSILGGGIELFDVQLLVFLFAVDGMLVIPLAWLKLKENAFTFFILTSGKAVCQAILSWQLLQADFGITSMLLGGSISSILLVVILAKLQYSQTGFRLDVKLLPELLLYGAPLVISAMAAYALLSADRWVINMVSTPEQLGLYAVGKKLAFITFILMQPFWLWWAALRFKTLNGPGGKKEVARITSFGIALAICFSSLVVMGSPIVIDLFINERFSGAMTYLPPMALLFVVKQVAEMANLGCYVGRTTWTVMAIDLSSAFISILCLYFLSQIYGIEGVIASLLIAQSLRLTSFYLISQKVLYLDYAKGKLLLLIAICLGLTYVSLQIDDLLQHFVMLSVATLALLVYVHFSGLFSFKPLLDRILQRLRPPTPI